MNDGLREALRLIDEVGERFQQQTERLTTASVRAGMQINDNRDALRAESQELVDAAREAAERIKLIGDAFSQQVGSLTHSSDGVSSRLASLAENFRLRTKELNSAGEAANRHVRDISDGLSRQAEILLNTTNDAKREMETIRQTVALHGRDLKDSVEAATKKTKEATQEFDRQAAMLTQASSEAARQAESLKAKEEESRRDLFLKTARHIVEDLHSTSIDLTRLLSSDIPDADWKRYTRGERGIFTRALLRGRQSNLVAQIADKIKLDEDMRRYAMRYIDYFERLLKESQAVDPENLLHSTFMTGDVGKLYLLLCRATGRDPFGD